VTKSDDILLIGTLEVVGAGIEVRRTAAVFGARTPRRDFV
jgi:hypothetical protein